MLSRSKVDDGGEKRPTRIALQDRSIRVQCAKASAKNKLQHLRKRRRHNKL